jgi:acyl-CoA synthetase (AMP-forming)/AMP-acid ligase II
LVTAVKQRLKSRGADVVVSQGYGLTETSPITHCLLPEHSERKVGSIGWLLPNIQCRLVDELPNGEVVDVAPGEPGEIWVKGANIMKGYLNNKQATKNSITPDKWFKTGDVAIVDDEGFFFIVDRRKELIKYKGFQVPPAELESSLLQHPDVADAAVIGIHSEAEATELPRGYIVSAKPLKTQAEKDALAVKVQKWIETKVAKHKYLRGGVVIIDVIPKSASGKILRKDLRERAKTELAAGVGKPKAKL